MPRTSTVKTNFTAGEVSPRLLGRTDLAKYANGAKRLLNFIPQKHGGAIRRSGTRFVAEVADSTKFHRLIPFRFSVEQSYILEFGDETIRFYRDRGRIVDGASPPDPLEIASPYASGDLADLWYVQSADVLYLFHRHHAPRKLARTGADNLAGSWVISLFEPDDGPYLEVNQTNTTITPSATTGSVTLTASTGIFDADRDVGRLVRLMHTSTWGWARITAVGGATSATATVGRAFGGTGATADWRLGAWHTAAANADKSYPVAAVFHDGRLWTAGGNLYPQTLWASVVGDFENFQPTAADGTVADDDAITRTIDDELVNEIHWLASHNRGLVVGTSGGIYAVVASATFAPLTPDDLTMRKQVSHQAARITPHGFSNKLLFVQRALRKVRAMEFRFDLDQFIAPDVTILAEHITSGGVTEATWQEEPDGVLWLIRADGSLLSMTYDPSEEVIAWAVHDLTGTVESIAVTHDDSVDPPVDQLWMIVERGDQRHVEFMEDYFDLDKEQEDAFYVDAGLTFDGRNTDADDTLTISDGSTWNTGEEGLTLTATGHTPFADPGSIGHFYRLHDDLGREVDVEVTAFTSSSVVTVKLKTDVPVEFRNHAKPDWSRVVDAVAGLDHLEGEEVAVLADGAVLPPQTVEAGSIPLPTRHAYVHAGLPIETMIRTLPVEVINSSIDSRGRIKQFSRVFLFLHRSLNMLVGGERIIFREPDMPMGLPPTLFTGMKEIHPSVNPDVLLDLTFSVDQPVPCNLLSLTMEMSVGDA